MLIHAICDALLGAANMRDIGCLLYTSYKEVRAKLRYGVELAEQRLIEETARREGTLCYGRPDGKVVRISATEDVYKRQA